MNKNYEFKIIDIISLLTFNIGFLLFIIGSILK